MQSVFGNHRLTHANVSLAHKFSQKDPIRGQNDARFCCNTSGVPTWIARRKTLAASRQNAGILIRRLYVRADYSRKKSDLAGAYEPEAHKPEKERFNWEAAGVILPGVDGQRKALKVARLRYMKVADASSNKDTLKSSIPSSRLFGKLKVQSIWTPSRQDSKHDIGISGRNGEIIQSSCKERSRAENFPPKDKVDSLRFKGKTTEFAAQYSQKSKNDMVTPGRRRESILESENLYEGRGKPKNDVPKRKISSLKNRGEGTEFVASSEAMPESENVYGGRGDYVYHLPRNKVKPLNVPRGEGIEFGGAADFFSLRTFKDLGSNDNMLQALKAQQIHRPSHIQAMAYKHVLDGETCIVAEQSGSGKTLAYLAPLVQRLREEEIQGKSKSLAKCPRGLVLVPTAELAAQYSFG